MLTVIAGRGWGEAVGGPPAVVAGHGLGAMVAVEMARLEPGVRGRARPRGRRLGDMLEATRMLPMQLVEAMAEPPEVMASMEAWLADRRAFDPSSWDADQEAAARAQVIETHAGRVGLVTRAPSSASGRGHVCLPAARRWRRCAVRSACSWPTRGRPTTKTSASACSPSRNCRAGPPLAGRAPACVTSPVSGTTSCAIGPTRSLQSWPGWPSLGETRVSAEYHGAIVGPELVLLIILLVVLVFWRGPSTLPQLGEALGKAVKGARTTMPDSKDEAEARLVR